MWNILNGTIINALAVAGGCCVGGLAGHRLPERLQRIILNVLGLITITLGVDAGVIGMDKMVKCYQPAGEAGKTYAAMLGLVMVASLIIGSIAGTLMRWHEGIERLGEIIHEHFSTGDAKTFAEGFLTASVIFCVGPLTMLGCLKNGAEADPSYLYIKSLLDGFCSIALTASLGVGVAFSIVTVLLFQGGLAIAAYYFADMIPQLSVDMMNVVGGVLLLATALMILDIKRIPVANMLPALFVVPILIWLVEQFQPGLLLTQP